LHKVNQNL